MQRQQLRIKNKNVGITTYRMLVLEYYADMPKLII